MLGSIEKADIESRGEKARLDNFLEEKNCEQEKNEQMRIL